MYLSKTVTQDVDFDVEVSIDECIEFLEDEGYEVVLSTGGTDRDKAKAQIEALCSAFGGRIVETDYYHGTDLKVPPGSTVVILSSL